MYLDKTSLLTYSDLQAFYNLTQSPMSQLKILITGTSRGIGFESALAFARAGHTVFATMRNPERSPELKEIAVRENLPIHIRVMDVNSDESVTSCITNISEEHGFVDVLINNAGIEKHGSVEEQSVEDYRAVMETNYFGALRCMKAVVSHMRKEQKGCIINVASIAGRISNPPLSAYAPTKFALEALTEAFAAEMKPFNVRVYLVEPGVINTDMAQEIGMADDSIYPHKQRFAAMFRASLQNPTSPSLIAEGMLDLVQGDSQILRHPMGPDAIPFLEWRKSMTDEEWVAWNAMEDEPWLDYVQENFGLDARAALAEQPAH